MIRLVPRSKRHYSRSAGSADATPINRSAIGLSSSNPRRHESGDLHGRHGVVRWVEIHVFGGCTCCFPRCDTGKSCSPRHQTWRKHRRPVGSFIKLMPDVAGTGQLSSPGMKLPHCGTLGLELATAGDNARPQLACTGRSAPHVRDGVAGPFDPTGGSAIRTEPWSHTARLKPIARPLLRPAPPPPPRPRGRAEDSTQARHAAPPSGRHAHHCREETARPFLHELGKS